MLRGFIYYLPPCITFFFFTEYEDFIDERLADEDSSSSKPNFSGGFGFRKTSFLTREPIDFSTPLFVKKSTKPAPSPQRPAVLGPFFVGKDFLTRPAPIGGK